MKRVLFVIFIISWYFLHASNGVWTYTTDDKFFSYSDLGTTRANDEINTKNIMLTYQNSKLPTEKFVIFNNFPDAENDKNTYPNSLGTHYLYSPEDFYYTKRVSNTLQSIGGGKPLGNRIPIILVHGWQGDNDSINPKSQIEEADSPEEYWHNLITFFTEHHNLNSKYKIYIYKYPSYKHISFNGQILKNMLSDENIIPELKNKEIVFISHSMGTLVVRSAFEEHKLPINKAKKLFFLAGVHHGSPASIPNLVPLNTIPKELYTLGANDIQWDNYDNLFTSNKKIGTSNTMIKEDILKNFVKRFLNVKEWSYLEVNREELEQKGHTLKPKLETYSQPSIEPLRLNFYGNNTNKISPIRIQETYYFDEFFRERIPNNKYIYLQGKALELNNVSPEPIIFPVFQWADTNNYEHAVLPLTINPWLTHLNDIYKSMSSTYKQKLLFYAGVNSNGTFIKNNKLSDSCNTPLVSKWFGFGHIALKLITNQCNTTLMGVAEDGVSHLGELVSIQDSYGYLNDGPVPMTSALLDLKYSFDDLVDKYQTSQVRVYNNWIESDDATVVSYSPNNINYLGDGYSKHILFMDYHHDRMKSGGYGENSSSLENSETGFWRLNNETQPDRKDYILNATYDTFDIDFNELSYFNKDYINLDKKFNELNTINYEPLFLSIAYEVDSEWFKKHFIQPDIDIIKEYGIVDIPKGQWYVPFISRLLKDKIVKGDGNKKTFRPSDPVSRVEALQMIFKVNKYSIPMPSRLMNKIYSDVEIGQWYDWAVYNGFYNMNENVWGEVGNNHRISFWDGNQLEVSMPITRAEAAHMIANATKLKIQPKENYKNIFSDLNENHEHYRWIMACVRNGFIEGYKDGTFKPEIPVTRAEMAKLISLHSSITVRYE